MGEMKVAKYCYKCGYIDLGYGNRKCPFCNTTLRKTDYILNETIYNPDKIKQEIFKYYVENCTKFDLAAYNNRLQQLEHERQRSNNNKNDESTTATKPTTYEQMMRSIEADREAEAKARQAAEQANAPHCPTCGSTDMKKIDALDRAISVSFLGLASGKIGKSFKCNHCGYMW